MDVPSTFICTLVGIVSATQFGEDTKLMLEIEQ